MFFRTNKPMRAFLAILIAISGFTISVLAVNQNVKIDKKTAYLIIDIQNDYFPEGKMEMLNSDKAAANAKAVLDYFRKNKLLVIHIRHENTDSKAAFFIPGTKGAEIHSSVAPLKNETILLKHKPNSFIGTTLEEDLKKNGITDLVISGMQSNVCVKSTTIEALTRNYTVTVLEDCIAAKNEELHINAVAEMKNKGAIIANSGEIIIK